MFWGAQAERTERIKNCLNPAFSKTFIIDYYFEVVQKLKFGIYDIDNKTVELSDDDFLGECECTLGQVGVAGLGWMAARELGLDGAFCVFQLELAYHCVLVRVQGKESDRLVHPETPRPAPPRLRRGHPTTVLPTVPCLLSIFTCARWFHFESWEPRTTLRTELTHWRGRVREAEPLAFLGQGACLQGPSVLGVGLLVQHFRE